MTVTINGSGAIVGSDRAESGVNDDITSLAAVSSINGGQLAGMRNRIINGGFGVWQRGTSFTLSSSGTYTADRWIGAAAGANLSATRGAGFSSQYAFALSGAVGNTFAFLKHRIESANAYSLANHTVTLSGKIFNNSAAVVPCGVELNFATAADNFSAVTYIEGKSVPLAANSWTFVSFTTTGPLPAGVTAGLEVGINLTSGLPAGTSIAISDFQLEVGSVATPFEHRPYGMELALCQRYYTSLAKGQIFHATGLTSGVTVGLSHQVSMRTPPSISTSIVNANFSAAGSPPADTWGLQVVGTGVITKTGTAGISFSADTDRTTLYIHAATFSSASNALYLGTGIFVNASAEL